MTPKKSEHIVKTLIAVYIIEELMQIFKEIYDESTPERKEVIKRLIAYTIAKQKFSERLHEDNSEKEL